MRDPNTILLIEKDAIVRRSQTAALRKQGYKVTAVSSASDAEDAIRFDPSVHLILLDIGLGKAVEGTVTLRAAIEEHDVPVVFLVNRNEKDVTKKIGRITPYGYVVKGSHGTVMDASVKTALRLHEDEQKPRKDGGPTGRSPLQLLEATEPSRITYWEYDPKIELLVLNDPFYTFFGTTATEEGGYRMRVDRFAHRFIHPQDVESFLNFRRDNEINREREFVNTIAYRTIRRTGDIRCILATIRVVKDDRGRTAWIYGACQDVTDRRKD